MKQDISGYSALSLGQHPVEAKPWPLIHPCQTAKLMGELTSKDPFSHLVAWMTVFLPLLGFSVPADLLKNL